MVNKITTNPKYLQGIDEGTHTPIDADLWSENYLTQAYSPETATGTYIHQGRTSFDPNLWNSFFVIYLPGDQYLVSNSYHYGDSSNGPTGGQLRLHCDTPFEQWTKTFRGAACLVSGEQLRLGAFVEGLHVQVDMELKLEKLGPVFDLGVLSSNDTWSKAHYEQHHTTQGYVKYADQYIEFNGSGIRDHSWGPRNLLEFNYHSWMSGQFPSGRTFMVFSIVTADGQQANHVLLGDKEGLQEAVLLNEPPHILDPNRVGDGYEMQIQAADGKIEVIRAEILQAPFYSMAGESELLFGKHSLPTGHHLLVEAQARYEWDGEIGYGMTDRSFKNT